MRVSPGTRRLDLAAARRRWAWALGFVAACGSTDGPLLRARHEDAAVADAEAAASGEAAARVRPGMRLQYQLTGELEVDDSVELFVVDLFEADAAQVASLRAGGAAGRVAIAYLSAGTFEPWRPDASQLPDSAIGARLASYPDEKWLDVRAQPVRDVMLARLQLARDKGFDGVFPSSLDAYQSDSGFALTRADQLEYDRFLASAARALGLSISLSGDFALTEELAETFDWAIAFDCLAANSCAALQPLLDRHKAVFDLELSGEPSDVCARAEALGITAVLKHPAFDAWSRSCP